MCVGFLANVNSSNIETDDNETVLQVPDANTEGGSKYYFANTVQEFKDKLKEHESKTNTKYVLRCGPKSFTSKMISFSPKSRLHWHENVPYFHFGTRFYNCHQGKDNNIYQKKKYVREREAKVKLNKGLTMRCNVNQTSKKVGCPAVVNVTRMYRMLGHKLTTKFNHKAKTKVSLAIKDYLAKGILVDGEEVYMFSLPDPCEHKNHAVGGNAAVSETPDPRLLKKIRELVQQGKTGATSISKQLELFVSVELHKTDKTHKRFYPSIQTIKNAVADAKRDFWSSKIDLEKTQKMLRNLNFSSENVFFMPDKTESNSGVTGTLRNVSDNSQQVLHDPMLFVYQNNDMKQMFCRYGTNTVLLDATYRACKYAIPVYFLVVKTNVNFEVVGIIISQHENKEALCKALTVIKSWNPEVKPKYALVDVSKDEIMAMETVFPETLVFISSYHREKAWTRWASRCKKADDTGGVALVFLRQVSDATTEDELQQAIHDLKSLPFYATTSLKSYFEWLWMNEIRRWALAYKPDDMLFNIDKNIGCLTEQLGYKYLESFKNCLLSEHISNLVQAYTPDRYASYVLENLRIVTQPDNTVPDYLHNRPKWLVDHIENICTVAEHDNEISVLAVDRFAVHSTTCPETAHVVSFEPIIRLSRCTCRDYRQTGLVCHHVASIGLKHPEWSLPKICDWLFSNPVYKLDESVAPLPVESIQPMTGISYVLEANGSDMIVTMNTDQTEETKICEAHEIQSNVTNHEQLIGELLTSIDTIKSVLGSLDKDVLVDLSRKLKDIVDDLPMQEHLEREAGLPTESDNLDNVLNAKSANPASHHVVTNLPKNEGISSLDPVNVTHVIDLQTMQPNLCDGEVVIGNVVFDFECDVPLAIGAIATVEPNLI